MISTEDVLFFVFPKCCAIDICVKNFTTPALIHSEPLSDFKIFGLPVHEKSVASAFIIELSRFEFIGRAQNQFDTGSHTQSIV